MALSPPNLTAPRGVSPTTTTPTTPRANPLGDPNSVDPAQRARYTRNLVDEIKAGGEFGISPFDSVVARQLQDGVRQGHITARELGDLRHKFVRDNVQRVLGEIREGLTNPRDPHAGQVLGYAIQHGMVTREEVKAAGDANKERQQRSMEEIRRILRNP